ncbi:DUF4913 domain-containing protein [Kitasatospora sp. HPMI-4]|uniref:DUF4913 domain-containing protein n=1 Tax=Kitasatospora sp. HPMI-4 TaxID=3448443 RepID=UPI003F19BC40
MSEAIQGPSEKPIRIPVEDFHDLASALTRTIAEVRQHGVLLDHLTSEDATTSDTSAAEEASPTTEEVAVEAEKPASVFILALVGEAYDAELAALRIWVDHLLLPVYGREISTTRPWCHEWDKHLEAVARLHGLWLAWQQMTDAEAGLAGPSTWHRDHLAPALLELRAADGPFAACTTSPARPNHRLLAGPVSAEFELAT